MRYKTDIEKTSRSMSTFLPALFVIITLFIPTPGWSVDSNESQATDLSAVDGTGQDFTFAVVLEKRLCSESMDCIPNIDPTLNINLGCIDYECVEGSCNYDLTTCYRNPCVVISGCDTAGESCIIEIRPDGSICNDGNACTFGDRCLSGECKPTGGIHCLQDNNPCDREVCDPNTGQCGHDPLPDGTACDDNNLCTGKETCQEGVCKPAAFRGACPSDNDPCTMDTCNPSTGQCIYASKICDDRNPCTQDSCDPAGGCVYDPRPLNDAPCIGSIKCNPSFCSEGRCREIVFVRPYCDDNNSCTENSCEYDPSDPDVSYGVICLYPPVRNGTPCNDGDVCTMDDTCYEGICHAGKELEIPGNPHPGDGDIVSNGRVNLTWTGDGDTYDVYLNSELLCGNISETTCPTGALNTDTLYSWWVISTNDCGTTKGPNWSFTTKVGCEGVLKVENVSSWNLQATVPVNVENTPNPIETFTFDVHYDPQVMKYQSLSNTSLEQWGECIQNFNHLDVYEIEPGHIRVGGFDGLLPANSSCTIVELVFNLIAGDANLICTKVGLSNPTGGMIEWHTCPGKVCFNECMLGDIDRDGDVDIDDVFCLFKYVMGRSSCLDDINLSIFSCADIDRDGDVDIDDVFCLFKYVMGRPSCLDDMVYPQCKSNQDCHSGEFCEFPAGGCDDPESAGKCLPQPTMCPLYWSPVCGCDGTTYGNDCERQAAGVALDYEGVCVSVCRSKEDCNTDEFCEFPAGQCGTDSTVGGTCTVIPMGCPDVWDPVCGCDGETYSNDCDRQAAQVQLAHKGECDLICRSNDGCNQGDFCEFPPGECEVLSREGKCLPIPDGCPKIWEPVCGCDGKTYGNDCYRQMAQVPLGYKGECKSPCLTNKDCNLDEFCELPGGQCDIYSNAGGICTGKPMMCPDVWAPVCGCDGKTYGNDCERQAAGVSLDHKGECNHLLCQTDDDCRTYSDYCSEPTPCTCHALHIDDPVPDCNGSIVYCLVDPCAVAGNVVCNQDTGKCEFAE